MMVKKTSLWVLIIGLFTVFGAAELMAQVLDDRANMKILKTRSKLATGSSTYVYSNGQLDALSNLEDQIRSQVNCGSVDIANQSVDSNFAGEINVIIAGDIVNTGNNCR